MTEYQKYSKQVLNIYDERYDDFSRYVKEAMLNDKLFREWLQFALENIVYVFKLIEESEEMKILKMRYELLLDAHLDTVMEMD
jgi:hypothetical protein